MDNQWKDETCCSCDFRRDKKCRKFPPSLVRPREFVHGEVGSHVNDAIYDYPEVGTLTEACSCWREK